MGVHISHTLIMFNVIKFEMICLFDCMIILFKYFLIKKKQHS
jgi:hypothetical protein